MMSKLVAALLLLCVHLPRRGALPILNDDELECPSPEIDNGKMIGNNKPYRPDSVVKFECNEGFKRLGFGRILCQEDGTWSDNPPFCQEISCPYPAKPHNGDVGVQNISLPGDSARYKCDVGYEIQGKANVTCSRNGTWVPNKVPSCCQIKVTSCHYGDFGWGNLAWIIPLFILLGAVLGIICWKTFCKDRCQGCNAGEHLLEAFIRLKRLIPLPCLPARRNQGRNSGSDGDDSVSSEMIPGIKGEDSEEEVSPETLPAT